MKDFNRYQNSIKRRLEKLQAEIDKREAISRRFSWIRLFIFLTALVVVFSLYWVNRSLSGLSVVIFVTSFALVAWQHRRVEFSLKRFSLFQQLLQDRLSRLTIEWSKLPAAKDIKVPENHPLDRDLNITGPFSLHQLLDVCITEQGSERLASWLLTQKPAYTTINSRQQLVKELVKELRFRDRFVLHFRLFSKEELDGDRVRHWLGELKKQKSLAVKLLIAALFCVVNVGLLIAHISGGPEYWWLYGLIGYMVYFFYNRDVWQELGEESQFLDMEFKQSLTIFNYLEAATYRSQSLAELCHVFINPEHRPSRRLQLLMVLTIAIGLRMNYLTGLLLNVFFPYDFLCAFLLNRQKSRVREDFESWLDVVYELDALNALANFSALFSDVFPRMIQDLSTFRATALGHPFLRPDVRVCNDFELNSNQSMVLITGSNMSGKSTFLRTIGINMALAYTGAPVIAEDMQLSIFRLFCCIQVNDSITEGVSQFYAEVKRLKELKQELEDSKHVLFLVDEIFKGTNNRERFIGSRSYIRFLLHTDGLGAISTHDLELTNLADESPRIRNSHFREFVENGQLVFDYKLRSGPCPTTNALKIMRLEGLPIESE